VHLLVKGFWHYQDARYDKKITYHLHTNRHTGYIGGAIWIGTLQGCRHAERVKENEQSNPEIEQQKAYSD
jgi:hypothetical protein